MGLSADARELKVWIENDGNLHRQMTVPIFNNLRRKIAKGTFRKDLSVKAFRHLADRGTKNYQLENLSPPRRTGFFFSVSVRNEVARALADDFAAEEGLR
ncbi:hypothetical protein LCGC14_0585150 [marine sediment metagenome]|uniref:Uncharacterized protein n=1 Tax=marine sediment metagenome TaxID=412755 RepID=A0A0F9UNF2_9ZZZZ